MALRSSVLKTVTGLAVVAALYLLQLGTPASREQAEDALVTAAGDSLLRESFAARRSDVQVRAAGTVTRILKDDIVGSRHQRFLLETGDGLSLLVAHNIDLAPRVENLALGDRVEFFGEYEWNNRGGVVHWTHRDPRGTHPDGWLRHDGQLYQ